MTYMSADFRSLMGSTPFFSPSIGSENRLYASLISPSSCADTLCSLASFDSRGFGAVVVEEDAAAPAGLRRGGYTRGLEVESLMILLRVPV